MVGLKCFLPRFTKKISLQNRKKTEGGRKCPCIIAHGLHPCCFSLHFFFFLFPSLDVACLFSFSFFFLFWQACPVFFFLVLMMWFFIFFMDVILKINKFRWLIFFWLFIIFFNWALFFNKGICVNLYKLTFSIPPFFHSQSKKKGEKLNSFLFSYFSILSPFSILPLFHPFNQTNP